MLCGIECPTSSATRVDLSMKIAILGTQAFRRATAADAVRYIGQQGIRLIVFGSSSRGHMQATMELRRFSNSCGVIGSCSVAFS